MSTESAWTCWSARADSNCGLPSPGVGVTVLGAGVLVAGDCVAVGAGVALSLPPQEARRMAEKTTSAGRAAER